MRMLQRFWKDEAAFAVSTELILIATVVVIGMIVGLVTVRDSIVQELGDLALAIGNMNQSFYWTGVSGCTSQTAGSYFTDEFDRCDGIGKDTPGVGPGPMSVQQDPAKEGAFSP